MIPGKAYSPELVLGLAWRRKWLILIPTVVIAAVACVITYTLKDEYRSETTVLVVPQQVPENYVRSTVTMKIEDRLRSINQQVRSRTRLERIIEEFHQRLAALARWACRRQFPPRGTWGPRSATAPETACRR